MQITNCVGLIEVGSKRSIGLIRSRPVVVLEDVKGNGADIKGNDVDVKGNIVDVKGSRPVVV